MDIIYSFIYFILLLLLFCSYVWALHRKRSPFLKLLDVVTVNSAYHFHALQFTDLWHKKLLPSLVIIVFSRRHINLVPRVSSEDRPWERGWRQTYNTTSASRQKSAKHVFEPALETNVILSGNRPLA